MDLLQVAKRARDLGYPLTRTPESVVIEENGSSSSQSPVSVSSQQSRSSTTSSGLSQFPVSNEPNHHNHDNHAPTSQSMEAPAAIRKNLREWWDSAAHEH